jgi:hypothetical protein
MDNINSENLSKLLKYLMFVLSEGGYYEEMDDAMKLLDEGKHKECIDLMVTCLDGEI